MLAWSGGKDSALALAALRADPSYRVIGCVTALSQAFDRVSMHGIRRRILLAQVAAVDLPLVEASLPWPSSNASYEEAWASALDAASRHMGPFQYVAYGDLFLEDVREYREAQLSRLGLTALTPLWGRPTGALAREFVAAGYEAYLTCVDTNQLPGVFAGRRFDEALLADLPSGVDPCGERGEFHTCVTAGPILGARLHLAPGERVLREGRFQYADFLLTGVEPVTATA